MKSDFGEQLENLGNFALSCFFGPKLFRCKEIFPYLVTEGSSTFAILLKKTSVREIQWVVLKKFEFVFRFQKLQAYFFSAKLVLDASNGFSIASTSTTKSFLLVKSCRLSPSWKKFFRLLSWKLTLSIQKN